jgi:hypothetical protein
LSTLPSQNKLDFLGQVGKEKAETMKSFGRQLDELMKLVLEGDLEKVKEHVESMPCSYRRPVLESTTVLSFKRGAKNEIVDWLASEVGTLKLTVSTRFTSMTKVK